MTVLQTRTISPSEIKLRWRETYVSDASNVQIGAMSRGIYRGGNVTPQGSPDESFNVEVDGVAGDTVFLFCEGATGFGNVIRIAASFVVNMSGQFPIVGDKTWYVTANVNYATGVNTTGTVEVKDTAPTADDIVFARLEIPNGATAIQETYVDGPEYGIKVDGASRTRPATRRGMIIPRTAEIPASPSRTSFQLADRVYRGTDHVISSWIRLSQETDNKSLVGSDGGHIRVVNWFKEASLTNAIATGDLDADGCFTDPYVKIGFGQTSDSDIDDAFRCQYFAYYPVDEIPTQEHYDIPPHAREIEARSTTTSGPDNLSAGVVENQLAALLGFVNERIKTIHPTASPTDWVLLWRSHNVTSDAGVTNDTVSIYFANGGFMFMQGGYYLRDASRDYMRVNTTGEVTSIMFDGTFQIVRRSSKDVTAAPDQYQFNVSSDWDVYAHNVQNADVGTISQFIRGASSTTFSNYASVAMQAEPGSGTDDFILLLHLQQAKIRVYWSKLSATSGGLVITFNCSWHNGDQEWKVDDAGLSAASQFKFGANWMHFKKKRDTDPDYATGWGTANTEWTTTFVIGGDDPLGMQTRNAWYVTGEAYEKVHLSLTTWLSNDACRYCSDGGNFRNYREAPVLFSNPMGGEVSTKPAGINPALEGIQDVDGWGFNLEGCLWRGTASTPLSVWAHYIIECYT